MPSIQSCSFILALHWTMQNKQASGKVVIHINHLIQCVWCGLGITQNRITYHKNNYSQMPHATVSLFAKNEYTIIINWVFSKHSRTAVLTYMRRWHILILCLTNVKTTMARHYGAFWEASSLQVLTENFLLRYRRVGTKRSCLLLVNPFTAKHDYIYF